MYKMTHSLLESWRRATDPDADETAFGVFLDTLGRIKRQKTKAMQYGIDFEKDVNYFAKNGVFESLDGPSENVIHAMGDTFIAENNIDTNSPYYKAVRQFGNRIKYAQLQVREEKEMLIHGIGIVLVGVADAMRAGIISDIKRVQRYEYGKYQFSTQHPMYMELFPEALRFDYLIFDGKYCYMEQYRRGDFEPIQGTIKAFLEYLDGAELMDTYKKNWEV